jgi:hypothetical protein
MRLRLSKLGLLSLCFGSLVAVGCGSDGAKSLASCVPAADSCVCPDGLWRGHSTCNAEKGASGCDCAGGAGGAANRAGSGGKTGAAGHSADAGSGGSRTGGNGPAAGGGGSRAPGAGTSAGTGVGGKPASAADGGGSADAGVATPRGPIIPLPNDPAAYLFDQSKLLSYNIVVAPADLDKLDQDPSAELYVPAMLEFEGQVYGPFAVRYKGGYSAFQAPCANGIGTPRIGKCSIKLAFDDSDSDARFYGLKKLNLHAMDFDPSLMHDRLGYSLYRDFGVASPRAVHALVYINGQAQGLFIAVEQVDGRFARAHFSDGGEGNIYKEIWPVIDDASTYVKSLESNTDQADVSGMLALAKTVESGDPNALAQMLDRDYMLSYAAVDRVIINDDGVFHFWCSSVANGNNPGEFGNHNYYWYQESARAYFWLVPWDLDVAFDGDKDAHIIVPWDQSAPCMCTAQGDGAQQPAACDPLVQDLITWKADYEAKVDAFLAGPFASSAVNAKLDAWSSQIADAVKSTANTPNAVDEPTWRAALDQLRQTIDSARTHRGYAY